VNLSRIEDEVHYAEQRPLWRRFLEKATRVNEASQYMPFVTVGDGTTTRFLDLGCGLGYAAALWKDYYRSRALVVAADLSPEYLKETRLVGRFAGADIHYVATDAHFLPFKNNSFDAVWSAQVLYRTDITSVVQDIKRVLKPGGRWVGLERAVPPGSEDKAFEKRYADAGRYGHPVSGKDWHRIATMHGLTLRFVTGRRLKGQVARYLLSTVMPAHITLSLEKPR
jgi:ubiquinone/menaquinone biosynthesis C-methylase UbiE